jgi:RND family efflux transporter MFP subunit
MKSKYFLPFCLLSLLLCSCHFGSQKDKNVSEIKVIPLEEFIGPYQKEYIGVLKPVIQVVLRSRVEGFLEQRLFKEGDFVQKDDLLFIIDKKPFEAQLLSAKGNLERAKADLAFQEVQLKRYQALVVHQNVSKSQYDQQYSKYLESLGNLDVAQGNYDQAVLNLGYCSVISPISGLAGKAYVDIGNLVTGGASKTDLVKVVQLDPIRVEFNPSVSDIKKFIEYRQNKPFPVEVSLAKSQQRKWTGIVDFYDNEINLSTSTLLLRTTIINQDNLLRPDLYVKVKVILDPKHHFVLVPYEKINDVQGIRQVLVVDTTNHLYWRTLKLGRMYKEKVEIESGIQKGDRIAVDQTLSLPDGTLVKPVLMSKAQ